MAEKERTPEEAIVRLLKKRKLTLSLAESCTGGAAAARIVDVPGASEVFGYGFVTYSNAAKHRLLRVKKHTLKKYGAVSTKTAKEMAKGGCAAAGSDICVSVTGLAGPGGGTKQTPVGTVCFACCFRGKTQVFVRRFDGDRAAVRRQAADEALKLLWSCLKKNISKEKKEN